MAFDMLWADMNLTKIGNCQSPQFGETAGQILVKEFFCFSSWIPIVFTNVEIQIIAQNERRLAT